MTILKVVSWVLVMWAILSFVILLEIFAMPHIYDSVVLILLSVRSHIGFAPCIVTKSASAKVISDGKFGLGSY